MWIIAMDTATAAGRISYQKHPVNVQCWKQFLIDGEVHKHLYLNNPIISYEVSATLFSQAFRDNSPPPNPCIGWGTTVFREKKKPFPVLKLYCLIA